MRDICAVVLTALLVAAVAGTAYVMLERQYNARDITDISAHRHKSW
ncbi:MAG: hypothetical protein HY242_17160 [Afipia sp.]|nr:hypothetical protein [Afipia sp.]